MINKIPISGGPYTGKTTLVEALQERFPDAYYVEEPAERVIDRELSFAARHEDYEPQVPWLNYPAFAPKVIAESEILEFEIPYEPGLTFLDRSLVDNIAYGRVNGFEDLIPGLDQKIWVANYRLALICQPLGSYALTNIRRETPEKALRLHAAIEEAYTESCIEIVKLPPVSIDERVALVETALHDRGII